MKHRLLTLIADGWPSVLLSSLDEAFQDPCSSFFAAIVAHLIAHYLAVLTPEHAERNLQRGSLAGLIAFFFLVYAECVRQGFQWGTVILVAGLRAWVTASLVKIVLGFASIIYVRVLLPIHHDLMTRAMESKRKADLLMQERKKKQEDEAAEKERNRPRPPPAPQPTMEESMKAAKERHEEKSRALQAAGLTGIELQSALDQAKKDYLRDIDRVMGK